MPDIIDTLVVSLGLDASKFSAGAKGAQEELKKTSGAAVKHSAEIEAAGAKAAEFFTKLKNEALVVAAIFTGGLGLTEFVAGTTKANIATGNLSKNLGISTSDLVAWERANVRAGGSAEGMDSALMTLNKSMQDYKQKGVLEGPLAFFSYLNVNALDEKTGKLRDLQSVMLDISNAMASRSPVDRASWLARMGLEGATNLLGAGSTAIQAQLSAMHQLGDVTEQDYQASLRLNAAWNDMKDSSESLGRSILTNLNGPLIEALKFITALEKAVHDVATGKEADPAIKRQQQIALRNKNSWLWDQIFGKQEPDRRRVSGRVVDEGAPPSAPTRGADLFAKLESQYGLPPGLLDSVWAAESGRGKNMLSPKGASGHFQFIPATAAAYGLKDTSNLTESATAAARMFSDLLRKYHGDLPSALAGYNWGSGNLDKNGMGRLPGETAAYIQRVMGGIPVGARATAMANGGGNVTTNETNIGQITINTKATDANGIAREIPAAIGRNSLVNQADRGVH